MIGNFVQRFHKRSLRAVVASVAGEALVFLDDEDGDVWQVAVAAGVLDNLKGELERPMVLHADLLRGFAVGERPLCLGPTVGDEQAVQVTGFGLGF